MPRNFGLSHIVPRDSSRAKLPGLTARLLYSVERLLQCAPYSLGKAHRPSGQQVSVMVEYMGRVLFHVGETRTYARVKSSQNIGEK